MWGPAGGNGPRWQARFDQLTNIMSQSEEKWASGWRGGGGPEVATSKTVGPSGIVLWGMADVMANTAKNFRLAGEFQDHGRKVCLVRCIIFESGE